MAFFLTPRFAPTYTAPQCSPWSCAPSRPSYSYRRVSRPAFSSFVPFLSQVDDLLSELDHEARREAHRQRQQRKRAFRAHFNVQEHAEGYQVDGEIPGFEQEHVEIEVTDGHTLRVAGNTEKVDRTNQPEATGAADSQTTEPQTAATDLNESMDGITINEPEQDASASGVATPAHSDTESHKSYQATVEDDFEDLGAETSSTFSTASDAQPESREPKGKGKAADDLTSTQVTEQQQPQPEEATLQQQQSDESRFQASFERTFRFPERIDAASVTASLKNGLLSITVPKAKAPEVKRILIQ